MDFNKLIDEAIKAGAKGAAKRASPYKEGDIIDLEVKDFSKSLLEVPVTEELQLDVKKKAMSDFVGFIVRYTIVLVLIVLFIVMFFVVKKVIFKGMFFLGALYVFGICTMDDVVIKYPYSNVKWYKQGIEKCYLAIVTYKNKMQKTEKNNIVLNDKYSIMPNVISEYSELDEDEVVLIVTRGDEFHLISSEEFLRIKPKEQSFKELVKQSFK